MEERAACDAARAIDFHRIVRLGLRLRVSLLIEQVPRAINEDGGELFALWAVNVPLKFERFFEVWLRLDRSFYAAIGAANRGVDVGRDFRLVGQLIAQARGKVVEQFADLVICSLATCSVG